MEKSPSGLGNTIFVKEQAGAGEPSLIMLPPVMHPAIVRPLLMEWDNSHEIMLQLGWWTMVASVVL